MRFQEFLYLVALRVGRTQDEACGFISAFRVDFEKRFGEEAWNKLVRKSIADAEGSQMVEAMAKELTSERVQAAAQVFASSKEGREISGAVAAQTLVHRYGGREKLLRVRLKHNAKEVLMGLGKVCWQHSYARFKEEEKAAETLGKFALEEHKKGRPDLLLHFNTHEGQMLLLQAARWVDQGLPVVHLQGHKYAAALLSSTLAVDVEVEAPWKAFVIEVPPGLLVVHDEEERSSDILWVFVHRHLMFRAPDWVMGWSFRAISDYQVSLWRTLLTTEEMRVQEVEPLSENAFSLRADSRDDRLLLLLSRLVLNTCVAMSDSDNVKRVGRNHEGDQRAPGDPPFRVFVVGKPVEVDCRQALKDYVDGARRSPLAVQFLVRGHYRNQACGPSLAQRRVLWIEPYWKGPRDAPINMRSHNLGGE